MRIQTKYTNITTHPDIEKRISAIQAAIEKLIDPRDDSAQAQIEVGKTSTHHKTGDVYRAEINMHMAGADFYAACENSDVVSALDALQNDILRKIKERKDKRVSFVRRGGRKVKEYLRGFITRKQK